MYRQSNTACAKLGILVVVGLIFIACNSEPPLPQYKPKPLEAQGKGITVAKNTPYNCKVLGEVEDKDNTGNTHGATKETLREGTINDLKMRLAPS